MQLLRQLYPGQFPTVKYNLFNIVLAVDLSQASSIDFIGGTVNSLIRRGLPFRWGVAPLVETEDGARMARLFYYLLEVVGADDALGFLLSVSVKYALGVHSADAYVDFTAGRAHGTGQPDGGVVSSPVEL